MSFNPSQLNPALLQAMAAGQAATPNASQNGYNNPVAFNAFHQAYQRLQSQESTKIDQQRLGIVPQQQRPAPQQNFPQKGDQDQNAQFLHMMQQAQAMQMSGQGGISGMPGQGQGMQGQGVQPGQGMQQGGMQPGQGMQQGQMHQGQAMEGQGGNMGGQGMPMGGMNIHSQQQGLNLQGMGESEQGRRQMLQNMLTQQLQNMQQSNRPPQQQLQQPPQQQQQQQQHQQQQQRQQQQAQTARTIGNNDALKEFMRAHPDYVAEVQQKHANNPSAVIQELHVMQQQTQQQQQRPPYAVSVNGMGQQPIRQPNFQQQPQQPNFTQPQHKPQQPSFTQPQQQQGNYQQPPQHQRMPSGTFQGPSSSVQGQLAGMANYDPKQFEALQQMKERQQRQGLVTPQPGQNSALPLVSPQPMQMGQITPQPQQQRPPPPPQQQQHQIPLNQPQAQRMMSNPQAQPQAQGQAGGIQEMIMKWTDQQLHTSAKAIVIKLSQPVAAADPTKFHLLQLIAEYKRRNLAIPNEALQAVSIAFGNPQFSQQLLALEGSQLAAFAKARTEAAMQRPPQRPQQGRPLQPNMPGSQNNPIEIVTPVMNAIPQLANQPNMGPYMTPLQPAAQINEQRYQQPPTQPRPPQHPATQQWVQQQQQPRPPVMTNPPAQPKPWAGMDFSKDPFPMSEEQFWKYLGSQHLKRPEPMPAPVIEGKPVNLYGLFNLVHKNGGSAKMVNFAVWSVFAGLLGLGTPDSNPGQPPRSTPAVAAQVRQLHAQFLQPIENLFYHKLFSSRQSKAQTSPPSQIQQPQHVAPPAMSAQFLEAVAKTPNTSLTDQQRQMLETARRQSQPSSLPPPPPPAQTAPVQAATPSQLGISASAAAQVAALKNNPGLIDQFVKNREEHMRTRFPQTFRQFSDEDKARFLSEIRDMTQDAREAQEKTPRFALMLLDRNPPDMTTITQLISMYMFIFTTLSHAESGRFPCPPSDLAKLRDPLRATLSKLNGYYKEVSSTPDGYAHLQRIFAALEQPMPPPDAGLVPRLRVEDLKPPPSRRPKTKAPGASPASTAAPTPPAHEKSSTPTGGKRKRQPSQSKSARELVAEITADIAARDLPPAPALSNALGINLDAAQAEIAEHAPFFASYRSIRSGSGSETTDIWSALTSALDEYQTVQGSGEDELFAEFIDVSKVEDNPPGYAEPTPELFRVGSREEAEGESDLSPESIKTVASTTGMGKTPADLTALKGAGVGVGGGLVLADSPTSVAYNGMVFGGWEDEAFDFGEAAA